MKSSLCALLALSLPAAAWAAPTKPVVKPAAKSAAKPTAKSAAKPAATAPARIDVRGLAALDQAANYYRKQRSFSVTAKETVSSGRNVISSSRLQIGLQMPYRASLKIFSLDDKGQPEYTMAARLMNANSVFASIMQQPAETEAIGAGVEARSRALVDIFRENPGVLMSVVTLAAGENMAREKYVKSVQLSDVRVGGRALQRVTVVRQEGNSRPLTAELFLVPATHAVEKVVMRGQNRDQTVVVTTEFSPLVPNWKGSQSATDAAIYSWKPFAPSILLASEIPATKIAIDAQARAVFARALKLYGAAQGLSVRWKGQSEWDEPTQNALEFDRAGRLRLASDSDFEPLIVFDGKNRWELDKSRLNEREQVQYSRAQAGEPELDSELTGASGLAAVFGGLLYGVDPFDPERFEGSTRTREFRVTLLAPQPFGGQACDIVRITEITGLPGDKSDPLSSEQQTFWFARSDGRLMRLQGRSGIVSETMSASDFQVTSQTINPTFAANTFKFAPPKGAVLNNAAF